MFYNDLKRADTWVAPYKYVANIITIDLIVGANQRVRPFLYANLKRAFYP